MLISLLIMTSINVHSSTVIENCKIKDNRYKLIKAYQFEIVGDAIKDSKLWGSRRASDTMRLLALSGAIDIQVYNSHKLYKLYKAHVENNKYINKNAIKYRKEYDKAIIKTLFENYYNTFSHNEIENILKIYETPSGKKLVSLHLQYPCILNNQNNVLLANYIEKLNTNNTAK